MIGMSRNALPASAISKDADRTLTRSAGLQSFPPSDSFCHPVRHPDPVLSGVKISSSNRLLRSIKCQGRSYNRPEPRVKRNSVDFRKVAPIRACGMSRKAAHPSAHVL